MDPAAASHPPTMRLAETGDGFPLVLLPGALTGWLSFEPHAEHWARERRVIRAQPLNVELGLRGETLPPDYSIELEARALLNALDEVGVDSFDLLGWSHGGGIAINVALAHPDRVRTLTLAEPDAYWLLHRNDRFGPDAMQLRRSTAALTRREVTDDQLATFLHDVGVIPATVDPRSVERWPEWVAHKQSLALGDIPFQHQEDIAAVEAFRKPVLLFKGTGSLPHMIDMVDGLASAFPNVRVAELPGGHAMLVASMDRFLEIVDAFLDAER